MQKSRDNKKKKDLYNDQTYKSTKNMFYSISQQVINENAIIFYQKNMYKQLFLEITQYSSGNTSAGVSL